MKFWIFAVGRFWFKRNWVPGVSGLGLKGFMIRRAWVIMGLLRSPVPKPASPNPQQQRTDTEGQDKRQDLEKAENVASVEIPS